MTDNASLLSQIERQRRRKRVRRIAAIVLLPFLAAGGYYGYAAYSASKKTASTVSTAVQPQVVRAQKGDIVRSVDADGTIRNTASVNLNFETSGTIKTMRVAQGQTVKAGQTIASLVTDDLEFSLRKARNSLQTAQANLAAKLLPPTEAELASSRTSIESAQASLDSTKQSIAQDRQSAQNVLSNAQKNLELAKADIATSKGSSDGDYKALLLQLDTLAANKEAAEKSHAQDLEKSDTAIAQLYQNAVTDLNADAREALDAIHSLDDILQVDKKNPSYDLVTFSAMDANAGTTAKELYRDVSSRYQAEIGSKFPIDANLSHDQVDALVSGMTAYVRSLRDAASATLKAVYATIPTSTLSTSTINSLASDVSSVQSRAESILSALQKTQQDLTTQRVSRAAMIQTYESNLVSMENSRKTTQQSIDNFSNKTAASDVSYESKIVAAEKQVTDARKSLADLEANAAIKLRSAELSVQNARDQLALKLQPVAESELQPLRAQIASAQIDVQSAENNLKKATLVAPIGGRIIAVNYLTGETVRASDTSTTTPIAVILNESAYEVDVSVPETDVTKISQGQTVRVTVDALTETALTGAVSYVSHSGSTSNGIVSYTVKVALESNAQLDIKDGMTAHAQFILSEARDVVHVPVAAVQSHSGSASVQLSAGSGSVKWQSVVTGITDGTIVEIKSGLKEGESVQYVP